MGGSRRVEAQVLYRLVEMALHQHDPGRAAEAFTRVLLGEHFVEGRALVAISTMSGGLSIPYRAAEPPPAARGTVR